MDGITHDVIYGPITEFDWRNWENPQSQYLVFGPKFDPRTSEIWSRCANHLTTTFRQVGKEEQCTGGSLPLEGKHDKNCYVPITDSK